MQKSMELNNGWLLCTDEDNSGKEHGFAAAVQPGAKPVPVPGIIQEVFTSYHGVVWYYLSLDTLPVKACEQERLILKFGAVDYYSEVFIDGNKVCENEGAENEFEIDVTDSLKDGSLIAVRCINPKGNDPIDGFELFSVPHRNKGDGPFLPGCCYNSGGIMLPVTLSAVPAVRVTDCFVRADIHTGIADLEITVRNDGKEDADAIVGAYFRFMDETNVLTQETVVCTAKPGDTVFRMPVRIENHRLWDIDSPNLYYVSVRCETAKTDEAEYTTHFGFREFKLDHGYFMLNGKRIFLKSAHTGNHMPESLSLPAPSMDYLEFKDFQLSKAAGFNCIRFIATQATPRQLDYCDKLGLMIYQETYASWLMADSDQSHRRYNESIAAEIKRDRNHPCITIWGALNETVISDAFYAAAEALPLIRSLDDTRLCIFSSGRFDLIFKSDRDKPNFDIGCASNPGSMEWDHVWGDDGVLDETKERTNGDLHTYPCYPYDEENEVYLRNYGKNSKPCIISEFGVGSHLNVIENCLDYERYGTDPTAPDYLLMRSIRDRYLRDFGWYKLDSTYATPVDHLRDSEKYNARSRRQEFDIVRSNPQFVGFNLTGLLDHAICGEGPYTLFRRVKPLNFDVFQDGWYDLRWCLFIEKSNMYTGDEQTFEAVLSDIGVLKNGEYSVEFAVTDPDGAPVWKTEKKFTLPEYDAQGLPLLVHPVLKQTVKLDLAPGKYSFRAFLKNGAYAAASEKEFYITARPQRVGGKKIAVCGIPAHVTEFLTGYGFRVTEDMNDADTILVGFVDEETGNKITGLVKEGKTAVFLDEKALMTIQDDKGYGKFMPLPDYACFWEVDWLYHKDSVITRSPMNDGLKKGFLDWDFFYHCFPRRGYSTTQRANEYYSVNFYVGGPGEYHSSVNLAKYNVGLGSLILNTFPIIDNLGKSPAAEILLLNILK